MEEEEEDIFAWFAKNTDNHIQCIRCQHLLEPEMFELRRYTCKATPARRNVCRKCRRVQAKDRKRRKKEEKLQIDQQKEALQNAIVESLFCDVESEAHAIAEDIPAHECCHGNFVNERNKCVLCKVNKAWDRLNSIGLCAVHGTTGACDLCKQITTFCRKKAHEEEAERFKKEAPVLEAQERLQKLQQTRQHKREYKRTVRRSKKS